MKRGFTLLELLVVIAIIGILSSVVLASVNSARDGAEIAAGLQFENQLHKKLYNCLVAQYDFEGGSFADSSGNGYDLTPTGSPALVSGANNDDALSFTASSWAHNSTFSELLGEKDFTVAFWVRPLADMTSRGVWGIGPGSVSGQTIEGFTVNDQISIDLWGSPTISSDVDYVQNSWQHVVISKTGSPFGSADNVDIIVNGRSTSTVRTRGSTRVTDIQPGITVGGVYPGTSYGTNVEVDNFRVYNCSL